MMNKGITPIKVTLIYVLKACGDTRDVEKGRLIHNHAIQNGLILYNNIVSAVVDMYARCSELSEAKKVFRDLVYDMTMISLERQYAFKMSIQLFDRL